MNWDKIEGNWNQVKGLARQKWGKLTEDDLENLKGKRDQLLGKLQESCGIARDEADQQIKELENQTVAS